jgi:CRP-like cAMP-binding protein
MVGWNSNLIRNLYLNTESRTYNMNEVIFKEGDVSNFMYIIKKGKFKI